MIILQWQQSLHFCMTGNAFMQKQLSLHNISHLLSKCDELLHLNTIRSNSPLHPRWLRPAWIYSTSFNKSALRHKRVKHPQQNKTKSKSLTCLFYQCCCALPSAGHWWWCGMGFMSSPWVLDSSSPPDSQQLRLRWRRSCRAPWWCLWTSSIPPMGGKSGPTVSWAPLPTH